VDRASLPAIRLHDLRHSYATLALDAGINPKIVSDRIGHASLAVTLQVYIHRTDGRDRDAAAAVAALFVPAPQEDPGDHEDQARRDSDDGRDEE
jgi:integrase